MFPIPLLAVAGGVLYVGVRNYRQTRRQASSQLLVESPDPVHRWAQPALLLTNAKEAAQRVSDKIVNSLAGQERLQQMQALTPIAQPAPIPPEEKQARLYMGVSLACLGVTTLGRLFYPPLMVLSLPGLIYTAYPFMKAGIDDLREKREVTATTLDLISIPGVMLLGDFFAASLVVSLLSISHLVLKRTEDHSLQSVIDVFGQHPSSVWALVDGAEVEIPFANIRAGDILVVSAGQMIPADGVIVQGTVSIDQRMLTGESQPSEKTVGDEVFAASLLLAGRAQIQVERAGEDTIAANIGAILAKTIDFRQTFESRSQSLANRWTWPTLVAAGVAAPLRGFGGSIAILLSSLGYNLRIIGPLSMLNFLRLAAQSGILIKDARSLELLQSIDTVVFDKTGTLTLDQLRVHQIHTYSGWQEDELLTYVAAAEARQSHPIGRALLEEAAARGLTALPTDEIQYEVGFGIKVSVTGKTVSVGSARFISAAGIALPEAVAGLATAAHQQGNSLVLVSIDGALAGAIELAPTVRPQAHRTVEALRQRGLDLYIISGDQEAPTRHLAQSLGIEHYFANTLPEHKASLIQQLQNEGKRVCFVGDGINDAIALKQANVSISLRGASTIATDTAQIVLMDASLHQLAHLFEFTQAYDVNMRGNRFVSMAPGMIVIGGVFLFHFGVIAAIALYNLGLIAGVANAMTPLIYSGPLQLSDKS